MFGALALIRQGFRHVASQGRAGAYLRQAVSSHPYPVISHEPLRHVTTTWFELAAGNNRAIGRCGGVRHFELKSLDR